MLGLINWDNQRQKRANISVYPQLQRLIMWISQVPVVSAKYLYRNPSRSGSGRSRMLGGIARRHRKSLNWKNHQDIHPRDGTVLAMGALSGRPRHDRISLAQGVPGFPVVHLVDATNSEDFGLDSMSARVAGVTFNDLCWRPEPQNLGAKRCFRSVNWQTIFGGQGRRAYGRRCVYSSMHGTRSSS